MTREIRQRGYEGAYTAVKRNLNDLNDQLQDWLDTVPNARLHGTTQRVTSEAFAAKQLERASSSSGSTQPRCSPISTIVKGSRRNSSNRNE